MMTLFTRLKADALAARKARLPLQATPLITLIGELETAAKNTGHEPTDAEVITAIKKTLKNIGETLDALKFSSDGRVLALLAEQKLFEAYLPKQMTREELAEAVESCIISLQVAAAPINTGAIMKLLKQTFDGAYDGKLANEVIKVALA